MHLSEMFSTAPTNYKHICQTAVSKHQSYITICIGQYFIFEKKIIIMAQSMTIMPILHVDF